MESEITSLQHPLVKHLVHLRQNKDYREEHQSALIEGSKLISEVCLHKKAKIIITCNKMLIPSGIKAEKIVIVNEAVMDKISGLKASEGLAAEVEIPKQASLRGLQWILACDGINDPGNLGTILRSGLALGWEGAFILNNSCDPYNDKAVRAAKGATFRLPLAMGSWVELNQIISENNLQPLAGDLKGTLMNDVQIKKNGVLLVLGSEAHGISDEAKSLCKKIQIPMPGDMESLNVAVAGGILMYFLRQQGVNK